MHCNTDFYMYQSIISHYWQCHMNVSSYKYKWYSCTKTIIWSHSVLVSAVQERHWHKPTPQRSLQIAQGWSTECKSGSWESMASSLKKRRKRGLAIWWENIERAQIRLGEIPQKSKMQWGQVARMNSSITFSLWGQHNTRTGSQEMMEPLGDIGWNLCNTISLDFHSTGGCKRHLQEVLSNLWYCDSIIYFMKVTQGFYKNF